MDSPVYGDSSTKWITIIVGILSVCWLIECVVTSIYFGLTIHAFIFFGFTLILSFLSTGVMFKFYKDEEVSKKFLWTAVFSLLIFWIFGIVLNILAFTTRVEECPINNFYYNSTCFPICVSPNACMNFTNINNFFCFACPIVNNTAF
eukprot:TRINITY_DN57_c3_g1_i1.p1 TRINITY_DN57_c3_g1~~TRINITY_DN57_c3_g1_i1.p1  ORF type:complete len:147 (-),score=46.47 TRINITY_DN57_c3_g1_i1:866-1306(-)